jgi:hypothetical protein
MNRPVRPLPLVSMPIETSSDELVRSLDRQRPKPQRVDQLKDRRVGPGAERERQDRDDGERRVLAEQAHAVPKVLPERLDEAHRVHVVYLLADLRRVAQLAMRRHGGVAGAHAARDVVVDLVSQVVLQLSRALVVPMATAKET